MKHRFIKGLDLSELYYEKAVKPILAKHFPDLPYSAALFGLGSEVLGFDTPQSMDHDWGPRLMLFLTEPDYESRRTDIDQNLRQELPADFHGYPTNFGQHADGTKVMLFADDAPFNHAVKLLTIVSFFQEVLNFDPTGEIQAVDWVHVPEYRLLMLTAGRVFHDGLEQLAPLRAKLKYYPDEVWFYLLGTQWRRIAQEEAFMGRCGQVGDDLGSRLIATRLVHHLMRLGFLLERRYAPYIKWLGSAFAQLNCATELLPIFARTLSARSWKTRQSHLAKAYEVVARMHNALGITRPIPTTVSRFHQRPFLVLHADRFCEAIRAEITSPAVLSLPEHLGSFDQFVDSTDAQNFLERFRAVYK